MAFPSDLGHYEWFGEPQTAQNGNKSWDDTCSGWRLAIAVVNRRRLHPHDKSVVTAVVQRNAKVTAAVLSGVTTGWPR